MGLTIVKIVEPIFYAPQYYTSFWLKNSATKNA
jgi:hypothetical protein